MDLPNQGRMSKLELTDVQYSPEVMYTLISVGNQREGICGEIQGWKVTLMVI